MTMPQGESETIVTANLLKEGDIIDIQGDKYFTDNELAKYEFAEVMEATFYEDYETGNYGVVVETSLGTAFVPEDHTFRRQEYK